MSTKVRKALVSATIVVSAAREAFRSVDPKLEARKSRLYLPFLLRRKDRLSMRSGVEVRVPFLDHRLVEYTYNIPADMRPSRNMEKGILREATADLLPPQVAWRRKNGYPASVTAGYRDALWQRLRDVLATPSSPILRLVNPRTVNAMLDLHAGRLRSWTPLQHTAYLLELNAFLRRVRMR